jgi:hypothetical protein
MRRQPEEFSFHTEKSAQHPCEEKKRQDAICCNSSSGPIFTGIAVWNQCDTNSYARAFGSVSTNDTGLASGTFFTGSNYVTVGEIEVFEITDSITLPNSLLAAFPRLCSDRTKHAFCDPIGSMNVESGGADKGFGRSPDINPQIQHETIGQIILDFVFLF